MFEGCGRSRCGRRCFAVGLAYHRFLPPLQVRRSLSYSVPLLMLDLPRPFLVSFPFRFAVPVGCWLQLHRYQYFALPILHVTKVTCFQYCVVDSASEVLCFLFRVRE